MASEIPSPGQALTKLTTIWDFIVTGDPMAFPSGFLPNGTEIRITLMGEVGPCALSWNNSSIQNLPWDMTNPLAGMDWADVRIIIESGKAIDAQVKIIPAGLGPDTWKNPWIGTIRVGITGPNTATTGTFVAQASSDGDGHPHKP